LPHMEDRDEPQSSAADIIGFIGLALAVLGLADMALLYRLACLAGASICLPVSFHRQSGWPAWVRWTLSVLTNFFLAYVAWGVIGAR
jgi:hypothetical protein